MQHLLWNSRNACADAERRFSTLVENWLSPAQRQPNGSASWTPPVDIIENAEAFVFTIELPGIKPEAVSIEIKDNILTMKGERQSAESKDGVRVHHRERPRGRFVRAFRLHKPVEVGQVAASYRDGLLEVVVPLRLEAKPRKIPVLGS
jgi:HSP20 family protein